jgi:nifR3 family TIM-barrel protein
MTDDLELPGQDVSGNDRWFLFGYAQRMSVVFWSKLKRPIMVLAPMANVTDAAFRRMFVEAGGRPGVFWTEFVSVEGLLSKGKDRLLVDFWYDPREHPIVAQIFGGKPEQFEKVGPLVRQLGFDGVDINMGCPDVGVEKSGGGAALIKDPARAKEIIRALKRGLSHVNGDSQKSSDAGGLPVSVKTRIGYAKNEIATWIPALLEENLAALTVHMRTRAEMSAVPAHWELARDIAALRDNISPETILLGNGDIDSLETAHARIKESGFDGVMVGRGAFGNPWFFSGRTPDVREKLERMAAHAELFEKLYRTNVRGKMKHMPADIGPLKGFEVIKKHFKAYCSGFDGAKEFRAQLMETSNAADVRKIVESFLEKY